ncbi:MAG: hypothetical protein ACXVZV_14795 [Terriglobales bacterium]
MPGITTEVEELTPSQLKVPAHPHSRELPSPVARATNAALWAGLLCSMAVWLVSIRTPLWLDETLSYWQINGGFRQLWDRQGSIMFVAYPFILWVTKTLFGFSVYVLRAFAVLGLVGSIVAFSSWGHHSFGPLDPVHMLRIVMPSVLALVLGVQIICCSFFLSILGLRRKENVPHSQSNENNAQS